MASSPSKSTAASAIKKKALAETAATKDDRLRSHEPKKSCLKKTSAFESADKPAEDVKLKAKSSGTPTKLAGGAREQQSPTSIGRRKPGRPKKSNKKRLSLPTRKRPFRAAAAKSRPSDDPSNPVALLDMLAEVASATLEKDQSIKTQTKRKRRIGSDGGKSQNPETLRPGRPNRSNRATIATEERIMTSLMSQKSTKKGPKRTNSNEPVPDQHLTLDQIRMLPDKMLLLYFSELTADEIRRNYSYVCFLVPDKCQQKYTSFGNENRARMQMKSHLLSHIAELLADSNTHGRSSQKSRFTAEPVPVRKRRLMHVQQTEGMGVVQKRRIGGSGSGKLPESKVVSKGSQPIKKWKPPTILKRKASAAAIKQEEEEENGKTSNVLDAEITTKSKQKPVTVKPPKRRRYVKVLLEEEEVVEEEVVIDHDFDDQAEICEDGTVDQPHHDHSYTSPNGIKKFPDHCWMTSLNSKHLSDHYQDDDDEGNDEDEDDDVERHEGTEEEEDEEEFCDDDFRDNNRGDVSATISDCGARVLVVDAKGSVVGSATGQSNAQVAEAINQPTKFRSKQAEMALRQLEAIRLLQIQKNKKLTSSTSASFSSSAATEVAETPNVVRIDVASQDIDEDDDDGEEVANSTAIATTVAVAASAYDSDIDIEIDKAETTSERGSVEWERKLALKYIRMLRLKKKDEHVPLVCRICEGQKCFTAQATLMYHYRSHAGIKPFMCSICQTTFTRQHSLNYHMLIHNNKSRFTCGDCGRQFRHPSHFKEHLRRHTGETPFECTDCGVRFKTRNTYKRHLKTRHGKLLTVNGIVMLSTEEFLKVKTNPKRRTARLPKRDAATRYLASDIDVSVDDIGNEATIGEEPDADDEDAIAARTLEQRDIVQAAVEAIMNEEAQQQHQLQQHGAEHQADEEEDDEGGGVSYTFYSIGVGTDPLNGKEIIVLEAVPQSQSHSPSAESTSLQPIVQCT